MSSRRDRGSALIESLVIGSATFLIVAATVSAAIQVALSGSEIQEAARAAAIHAARHEHSESAHLMVLDLYPGVAVSAGRSGDWIQVTASALVNLAHPLGSAQAVVNGRARMPIAPFRSDHG